MVRRVVAGVLVAFMVLVMAVTPLSATTQRGYFELWLPTSFPGPQPHVVLFDDTGLVTAFGPGHVPRLDFGAEPSSGLTRTLTVGWLGGCDDATIRLHAYPSGDRIVIDEQTDHSGCELLNLVGRQFTFELSSPIDASKVELTGFPLYQ